FSWRSHEQDLRTLEQRLSKSNANLSIEAPGLGTLRLGAHPDTARVIFHSRKALEPLLHGDHLKLAEAYLSGRVDIAGSIVEVLKATRDLSMDASLAERMALGLRMA